VGSAETVDVLIVGGGVIGVATAWCCAEAGLSVRLLERASLAAEASGRNQGLVIGPHPPAVAQLAETGLRRYLELHEVSGGAFAFDRDDHGCLLVSEGAGDAAAIPGAGHATDASPAHAADDPEPRGDVLVGDALRAVEPQLSRGVRRAVLLPARRVDPGALVMAMAAAARRAGADLRTGCEVKDLIAARDRVLGVLADDGAHHAAITVLAAGPWTGRVGRRLPFDVPVDGVRGWVAVTRPAPFRLRHAIEDADWGAAKAGLRAPTVAELANGPHPPPVIAGLLQQDHAGRVLLGASLHVDAGEHASGDEALAGVARRAVELVPALADLPVADVRTCRRPLSADGLPLHGPVPGVEGVVLACGHGSTGITWGGGSGEAVARGIVEGLWDPALLPARFVAQAPRPLIARGAARDPAAQPPDGGTGAG
jgi:D-hydroxyproline dehydrogenase subunit beta